MVVDQATAELREAESGQTVSAPQQQVLENAGIECGALTDITELAVVRPCRVGAAAGAVPGGRCRRRRLTSRSQPPR